MRVVLFNLTAGSHTLEIAYREDGAKLDRLLDHQRAGLIPTDAPERPAVTLGDAGQRRHRRVPGAASSPPRSSCPTWAASTRPPSPAPHVNLRRVSDSALVPATLNTSGGGDVIVLQPTSRAGRPTPSIASRSPTA